MKPIIDSPSGKLYCGDARLVLDNFSIYNIELAILDSPYGVNFAGSSIYLDTPDYAFTVGYEVLLRLKKYLSSTAHLYIFVPTLLIDDWLYIVKDIYYFKNILVVPAKKRAYNRFNYAFDSQLIVFASKERATKPLNAEIGELTSFLSGYYAHETARRVHPSQRDVALLKWLITLSSREGDWVIDPFAGSGSTLVAASLLNRKWIGIERDPRFCEVIQKRMGVRE